MSIRRSEPPLVSVIVNNFNYGEFLSGAIDSALRQTYAKTEIIVVDDGSQDDSRAVIERYRDRMTPIFKSNGGQASAFNAGFTVSNGEVVIFLDADDLLLPTTAARVVERFREEPRLVRVHYRLEVIDEKDRSTGYFVPAVGIRLAAGDVRARVLRAPDDLAHAPTSGNAFAASALRQILPMPEEPFRNLADVYLVNLTSLLGPIGVLDDVGGMYRQHERNQFFARALDLARVRRVLEARASTRASLFEFARSLGVLRHADEIEPSSVIDLAERLISLRLEPMQHPLPSDNAISLAVRGAVTALRRPNLPLRHRLPYVLWFLTMAFASRGLARRLSEGLFASWRAGSIRPRKKGPAHEPTQSGYCP